MVSKNTDCYKNFLQNKNVIYEILLLFLDYNQRLSKEKEPHLRLKYMAEKLVKSGHAMKENRVRIKQEEKELRAVEDLLKQNRKLEPKILEILFVTYVNYYITYITDLMFKIYLKTSYHFFENEK